jgi:hypothetical protein
LEEKKREEEEEQAKKAGDRKQFMKMRKQVMKDLFSNAAEIRK